MLNNLLKNSDKDFLINISEPYLFDELFKLYAKPLYYYAAKFVAVEIAKDIIQDLFVKLWSDQKIVVNKSLNSLLYTMVRNYCLQHLEKQRVRDKYIETIKFKVQEEELLFYMEEGSSLNEQALQERLNDVLNNLPDRCRRIFMMSRFENKKNKEIADELAISVKGVEKQITKALSKIRQLIK